MRRNLWTLLLNIDQEVSHKITDKIDEGDYSAKPGWIRLSIHPLMTNDEIKEITSGIKELAENHKTWEKDYTYNSCINEFTHLNKDSAGFEEQIVNAWFE